LCFLIGRVKDLYVKSVLFVVVFLLVRWRSAVLPVAIAWLIAPHRPAATKNDTYECA